MGTINVGIDGVDLWAQDTPSDVGEEPNPDIGPMRISQDIWVRNFPVHFSMARPTSGSSKS